MTATAETILVSRFPDAITPGALPILPTAITLHRHWFKPGTWIVYRWFAAGDLVQAPPVYADTLGEALELVPDGYELDWTCPEDFAPICYRLPEER